MKELKLAGITAIRRPTRSSARSICPPTTSASRSRRRSPVRPSPRSRASTSMRSCARRRSARSATTIACPTARSNCRSRRARCGRTSSRRGSRSITIPMARTPSFTARAASAATTRPGAGTRKTPPKSARWRACGNVDNAKRCPLSHRENRSRRSGHSMCYQNGQVNPLSTLFSRGYFHTARDGNRGARPTPPRHGAGGYRAPPERHRQPRFGARNRELYFGEQGGFAQRTGRQQGFGYRPVASHA